jgi:hypothetical protein
MADAFLQKPFHLQDLLAFAQLYAPLTLDAKAEEAADTGGLH